MRRERWSCRDGSELVAVTLDGWGHAWLGDAATEMCRFFAAHPRDEPEAAAR